MANLKWKRAKFNLEVRIAESKATGCRFETTLATHSKCEGKEGQNKGEAYSTESLQNALKQATAKADINKRVTLHRLRHSYATHLLESATDPRFIRELLGHKSSKITEIYTHVSQKNLQKIKSPFDDR
jgi:site-specific recombinase XerC